MGGLSALNLNTALMNAPVGHGSRSNNATEIMTVKIDMKIARNFEEQYTRLVFRSNSDCFKLLRSTSSSLEL